MTRRAKGRRSWAIGAMLAFVLSAAGLAAPGGASAAEFEEFGIENVGAELSTLESGRHPDFTTDFVLRSHEAAPELNLPPGTMVSFGRLRSASVDLPPGLTGNPNATPRCNTGEFLAFGNCPVSSQVGVATIRLSGSTPEELTTDPVFNLTPPNRNMVARLGFIAGLYPTFIDVGVRSGSDYGLTATVEGASGQARLISVKTTLWGNPADPSHNEQRLTTVEGLFCREGKACMAPGGARESGLAPRPFLTNPSSCSEQKVGFTVTSYEMPDQPSSREVSVGSTTECGRLKFDPTLEVEPTNRRAGMPTGLNVVLKIPQNEDVTLPATSEMKEATVALPEGMTISPGAADGLEACSDTAVGLGGSSNSSCPNGAKIGSATFITPALPEPLHGAIYQRTPTPGDLFRIWLVTDELGVHLKLPGEIEADHRTGQLIATFAETPQLPVEQIELQFNGGPRAPLTNPDSCGRYQTQFNLTPWSGGPPVVGQTAMTIDEGCAGGGFAPRLAAGTVNPTAGAFSPFVLELTREDGEQNVAGLDVNLPPGLLAKLAGVPVCPELGAETGDCPAASRIGSVTVAVGAGSNPLWIPQPEKSPTAVYLSAGYKGAPYGLVIKVPAQAGPFDLGTVVTRSAIYVDPQTTAITVKTDPLPQILEGVPISYRTVRVSIDRPEFTLNPTSCEPMPVTASVTAPGGTQANPTSRFQATDCGSLAFAPKLALQVIGNTNRNAKPRLKAVLTTKEGEANIRRAQVNLPHSMFLEQSHINTVCTRVQWAEGDGNGSACPKGSIYGRAVAYTPLLDKPLEGYVYLRSNGGERKLPDLVAALNGQVDIALWGKVDSGPNKGLRNTFEVVPDAPVSRFVLELNGKKTGLLVNSEDLCSKGAKRDAIVRFTGQNGKVEEARPKVAASCPEPKKKSGKGGKKK